MNKTGNFHELWCVNYTIKNWESERQFMGSQLINLYKAGLIHNDTQIKKSKGKDFFPFSKLMENQAFYEKLKDNFFVDNFESNNDEDIYQFGIVKIENGKPKTVVQGRTLTQMADLVKGKSDLFLETILYWDDESNKFISLVDSPVWGLINSL